MAAAWRSLRVSFIIMMVAGLELLAILLAPYKAGRQPEHLFMPVWINGEQPAGCYLLKLNG